MYIDKTDWSIHDKPHGECFECDPNIAPIICELNKKGYYTRACCEGHDGGNGYYNYILFSESLGDAVNGLYGACISKNRNAIAYKYQCGKYRPKGNDDELRAEFKEWVLEQEWNWCKGLPHKRGLYGID